jgi:hypothetical protein
MGLQVTVLIVSDADISDFACRPDFKKGAIAAVEWEQIDLLIIAEWF